MTGWLEGLEGIPVERRESPRPRGQPYRVLPDGASAFIIHTTEGDSVDGAWNTLNSKGAAPHFIVGEGRIVQMRPLWAQGATVHDHNDLGWQVECVGRAKQFVHQLTLPTWRPLVALTRFMHEVKGVPLRRPDGWKDDCSDINTALATDNTRRRSRRALTFSGLLGHLDIPDQAPTWHWDPGCLSYTALIREVGDDMTDAERQKLQRAFENAKKAVAVVSAVEDFLTDTPPPADSNVVRRRTYKALTTAANRPQPGDHDHLELAKAGHGHKTVGEAMPTG